MRQRLLADVDDGIAKGQASQVTSFAPSSHAVALRAIVQRRAFGHRRPDGGAAMAGIAQHAGAG